MSTIIEKLEAQILEIIGEKGTLSHLKMNEQGDGIFVRISLGNGVDDTAREMKREIDQLIKNQQLTPTVVLAEGSAQAVKTASAAAAAQKTKPAGEKYNGTAKIKRIVAITSGKGGVGKSSVTAALGRMLAARGEKVAILDADIYGPSIPMLFGVENAKPLSADGEMIEPITTPHEGIKLNSIGFFVDPQNALVWRGPMATTALKQLIHQTMWGEIDTLLLDMPPGTGDIHLTIAGELKIDTTVIVTTPSALALGDVVRGIDMMQNENIAIPVAGIINNMAYFTPADMPDKKYYIFGDHSALEKTASDYNFKVLCHIPLQNQMGEPIDPQLLNGVI